MGTKQRRAAAGSTEITVLGGRVLLTHPKLATGPLGLETESPPEAAPVLPWI